MFAYPKYPLKEVQRPMNHVYQIVFDVQQCCLIKLKRTTKVDSQFGCNQHFG
jgi:hypothetical protein